MVHMVYGICIQRFRVGVRKDPSMQGLCKTYKEMVGSYIPDKAHARPDMALDQIPRTKKHQACTPQWKISTETLIAAGCCMACYPKPPVVLQPPPKYSSLLKKQKDPTKHGFWNFF